MAGSETPLFTSVNVEWRISFFLLILSGFLSLVTADKINERGCGIAAPLGRIVGGKQITRHHVPWIVYIEILYKINATRRIRVKCGGSIISPNFILTAAHCLYSKRRHPKGAIVYYNETRRGCGPSILSEKIIRYPLFQLKANDIGLIKLRSPIPFDRFVHSVCLPVRPLRPVGMSALVAGWGRTKENGQSSDHLLYITAEVLPFELCKRSFNSPILMKILNRCNVICTSSVKKDACKGDSGGPLTVWTSGTRSVQVGIVSFGIGCARPNRPGIYTRVSTFVPWIEQKIAQEHAHEPRLQMQAPLKGQVDAEI